MDSASLNFLLDLDRSWFYKINTIWTHPLLDQIMPVFTDLHKVWWIQLFIFPAILILLIYKFRTRAAGALLTCAIAIALADSISYRIIKHYIQRDRPPNVLQNVRVLTDQYAGFSFTSNHAANSFAVVTVLSFFFPFKRRVFFLIASLIAYSRVYVGVHFPLDVIGGAILGILCGKLALWISFSVLRIYRSHFTSSAADLPNPPPRYKRN